jgi:hypothetical protein
MWVVGTKSVACGNWVALGRASAGSKIPVRCGVTVMILSVRDDHMVARESRHVSHRIIGT